MRDLRFKSELLRNHNLSPKGGLVMVQLHKRFTESQVKELIERYLSKGIERGYIQEVLGIGKTRLFLLKGRG